MPENRFFIPQPLKDDLEVPKEELQHLHVMRKKVGDLVEIVNGKGQLARATLIHLTRNRAEVHIEQVTFRDPLNPAIILAQALPRFNRLETIVEKAVELGVSAIWLFPAARSEKTSLSEQQKYRLEQIAIAALKQCGRLDLPPILEKPPLTQWIAGSECVFFGDIHPNTPSLFQALQNQKFASKPLLFFVGPESGFTQEEHAHMKHQINAIGVSLHPNILRVDTAAIVALSIISQYLSP